jgi:predicted ATPase
LVRLLPELADGPIEPLPAWTVPPEQERRLLFAAVARLLGNVAGPAGTLLVLDDLQWASADALDLLATLARGAAEAPLRVVSAYRDTDVQQGDALSLMLADLAHAGLVTQRTLAPLSPEDAGRLLDALLDGAVEDAAALRAQVVQRTGGVPFFVVSWAQVVRLRDATGGSADVVPWDVAQGIRQRVAALAEVAREVLGVAAVLGRVVQPDLLTAVSEQPERAVLAALDAAGRARLLVEDGATYQFAHDLIREVVEGDVGAAPGTAPRGGPGTGSVAGRAVDRSPGLSLRPEWRAQQGRDLPAAGRRPRGSAGSAGSRRGLLPGDG